jgi:Caspase domain
MRAALAACLLAFAFFVQMRVARATPVRILIAVSSKVGVGTDRPLKHAGRDADRMADALIRMGDVSKERVIRLSEPTRAELQAAFQKAAQTASAQGARPEETTLFFYFSGHGDRQALHLKGETFTLSELSTGMASVPADLRLVITDACRTRDLRQKGPEVEPGFAISVTPQAAKGAVWVHASADGEVAQESDELEGAVFSHYWTSGLLGAADLDGDKRITLSEAYTYAYNQTLYRSSQSSGVLQRPEVDLSVKEMAPIVLTRLLPNAATLRLPQSADTQYLVYTALSHSVMGEAWGAPDRRVTMGLPPGKYLVHRRGARSGALDVSLSKGEARDVDANDFRDVPEETLARKGGEVILRPFEAGLGYGVSTSTLAGFGQRLRLQGGYAFDSVALIASGEGELARGANDANRILVRSVGFRAGAELRTHLGTSVLAGLGAYALGLYVSERLDRLDADVVARSGYGSRRESSAFAAGAELRATVRLESLSPGFFELAPSARALFPKRGTALSPEFGLGLEAHVGMRF